MSRDLGKYARQTNIRLILGGLLILLFIGEGLIYLFYGAGAASLGLLCFVLGITPILLVIAILFGIEWLVNKADKGS